MRGVRKALMGYDIRQKAGWVRLWVLSSLMWMGFALASLDPPWVVREITVLRKSAFGDELARIVAREIDQAKESDRCVAGTASSHLLRYPAVPPWVTNFQHDNRTELDKFLARRKQGFGKSGDFSDQEGYDRWIEHTKLYYGEAAVERDATGRYPVAQIQVVCELAGRRLAQWAQAFAFVIAPPIALPAVLALVWLVFARVSGWLLSCFRIPEADTLELSLLKTRQTQPGDVLAKQFDAAAVKYTDREVQYLGKALSWSVVAALIIERTIREISSHGHSTGTNLLLFLLIALVIYLIGQFVSRRPSLSKFVVPWSLVLFWICAALVTIMTVSRFA